MVARTKWGVYKVHFIKKKIELWIQYFFSFLKKHNLGWPNFSLTLSGQDNVKDHQCNKIIIDAHTHTHTYMYKFIRDINILILIKFIKNTSLSPTTGVGLSKPHGDIVASPQ